MTKRTWVGVLGAFLSAAAAAWGQIPTREERVRDSGLNPDLNAWRTAEIGVQGGSREEDTEITVGYRYVFEIPGQVRSASVSLTECSRAWVFINGVEIGRPKPGRPVLLLSFDLAQHLQPGRNVLAVRQPARIRSGSKLAAEGIVFGVDGSVTRLQTDASWRVGMNAPPGFEQPAWDATGLEAPHVYRGGNPAVMTFTPPYYGRIHVRPAEMGQPIFDEEKPVVLKIALLNTTVSSGADGQPAPVLAYSVMDEFRRETVEQGQVPLDAAGHLDLAGVLAVGPFPKGAYRFRFVLSRDSEDIEHRAYEVAVVGRIPQREVEGIGYEDGLDLKEIWTVDCVAEPEQGSFITSASGSMASLDTAAVETRVVEGPAGTYREIVGESSRFSIGYRFKHQRLYVPHLAVVEWPDDAPRSFGVFVVEGSQMWQGGFSGYQRGDASFVSGEDHADLTHRMRKLRVLYWPNEEDGAVHIWHYGGRTPTAVSRITVYEIANDLPALRVRDGGDRLIGFHTERGPWTMASTYYAGPMGSAFWFHGRGAVDHPEFYRNWYTTTENMIKFMRFSGQNMYVMGQFMYSSYLYPSRKSHFNQNNYAGGAASRDYAGLILRMFERNGMSLVSSLQFVSSPDLLAAFPASPEEVRRGAPTILSISRTGEMTDISAGKANLWSRMDIPTLNHLHPAVQEKLFEIVEEILDLYAGYPSWKGINLILSRQIGGPINVAGWGRWSRHMKEDDPLDWGYEDYTVGLFEKETGLRVPVPDDDPERFGKRYDWIAEHARKEWVDWRCEKYAAVYRRLRDRLVRTRPDLTLYLSSMEPDVKDGRVRQCRDMDGHYDDRAALREVVRGFGLDPLLLKDEPNMVLGYMYSGRVPVGHGAAHELLRSDAWNRLWAADGRNGAYVWVGLTHHGAFRFKKGDWLFQASKTRQGYAWPREMREGFVNVFVRSSPAWLPHTWMDVVESTGRLHELRLFSRAYRSVPNGRYERLTGNGRDRNVWLSSLRRDGKEYLVLANTHGWNVDVVMTFDAGSRVHDLILDEPARLTGAALSVALGPYDVRTFAVEKKGTLSGSAALAVETAAPDARGAVERELSRLQQVVRHARERAEPLGERPGWNAVAPLDARLDEVAALMRNRNWTAAADAVFSWETRRLGDTVVFEGLDAIPFLAIGPFGRFEDTNVEKFGVHNPEVVPDYRGMETPHIGESDVPDCERLKPGFRPSAGAAHTVYPGEQRGWRRALKTYHLSFEGICESPVPYWMVAYAYTEVFSPRDRDVVLWAGNDHALWIYLNDERVLKHGGYGTYRQGQSPSSPRKHRVSGRLRKGWNRVLIKAVQRGACRIHFLLTDTEEAPLADLEYRVPDLS